MKAVFLTLILFAFAIPGNAQSLTQIDLEDNLRNKYFSKIIDMDSYCIFPEFHGDTMKSFVLTHEQSIEFHLSDSRDTLLIFDGKLCGGHESGVVNIYKFSEGEPKTVLSKSGRIAGWKDDLVWVYTYPCCAEVLNIIIPFSPLTGEKSGDAHVFYSRDDFHLIFPVEAREKQQYTLAKDTEIRWSPSTTEEAIVPVCESRENIVSTVTKGTPFIMIEVSSNDWVLIRLNDQRTNKGYCLSEHYQKLIDGEEYVLYGWVPVKSVNWE